MVKVTYVGFRARAVPITASGRRATPRSKCGARINWHALMRDKFLIRVLETKVLIEWKPERRGRVPI